MSLALAHSYVGDIAEKEVKDSEGNYTSYTEWANIYKDAKYDNKGNRIGGTYVKTIERSIDFTTGKVTYKDVPKPVD